ncbi:MAG: LNR domain-containing protein [Myxococcota bacterium]|nr:LNR domain-containing protein [Myxococcota bacterium]
MLYLNCPSKPDRLRFWYMINHRIILVFAVSTSLFGCQASTVATGKNAVCGDGVAQSGEICDGTDFGFSDKTCASFGFSGGDLLCNGTCDGFDTSYCVSSSCGNGTAEQGELCDGQDLQGESCESRGFDGGILSCSSDCLSLIEDGCFGEDTSTTDPNPVCGNGVTESGETCDGPDLAGASCQSLGFDSGILGCASDCASYDVSSCTTDTTSPAVCGDGIIEADEQCDGSNLGDSSCSSLGYSGGILTCNGSCRFDTSGCTEDPGCDCPASFIGDGFCDSDCNTAECNFDGGDCDEPADCAVGCTSTMLGDGTCDDACNVVSCSYDYGDCSSTEVCSDLCAGWASDGYCDLSCNTDPCAWDGGDCCASTCIDGTYTCGGSAGTNFSCEDPDACESTGTCESCSGLCGIDSPANGLTCSCAVGCELNGTCCLDYASLCPSDEPGPDPDPGTGDGCTGNSTYLSDGW